MNFDLKFKVGNIFIIGPSGVRALPYSRASIVTSINGVILSYTNIRIPTSNKFWGPLFPPALCYIWQAKGRDFEKLSLASKTLGITSEWWGEMFGGGFADTCVKKLTLRGQAIPSSMRRWGAKT